MLALFLLFPRFAPLWGTRATPWRAQRPVEHHARGHHRRAGAGRQHRRARQVRRQPPPPQSQLYFRGPVLAQFDGREWTALPRWARGAQWSAQPARERRAGALRGHAGAEQPPLAADARRRQRSARGARLRGPGTPDLQWFANRPVTDLVRYRAESYTQFRAARSSAPAASCRPTWQLPPGTNPRTAALAAEMRADPAPGAGRHAGLRAGRAASACAPAATPTRWSPASTATHRRRVLVRPQGRLLRAHRLGLRGADARPGHPGAHRHRLPGRRAQQPRQLLGGAPERRPRLGRGLAGRPGWVRVDPTGSVAPGRASASFSGWCRNRGCSPVPSAP
jgi:hypothetical protein